MTKFKELQKLGKKEIDQKIQDLNLELIKAKLSVSKGGKAKIREIRKTIARLIMLKSKQL
jgi:ribosomal protein L29